MPRHLKSEKGWIHHCAKKVYNRRKWVLHLCMLQHSVLKWRQLPVFFFSRVIIRRLFPGWNVSQCPRPGQRNASDWRLYLHSAIKVSHVPDFPMPWTAARWCSSVLSLSPFSMLVSPSSWSSSMPSSSVTPLSPPDSSSSSSATKKSVVIFDTFWHVFRTSFTTARNVGNAVLPLPQTGLECFSDFVLLTTNTERERIISKTNIFKPLRNKETTLWACHKHFKSFSKQHDLLSRIIESSPGYFDGETKRNN